MTKEFIPKTKISINSLRKNISNDISLDRIIAIIENAHRKGKHKYGYMGLTPELQDILLCPACSNRVAKVLGGHYVMIYSERRRTRHQRIQLVGQLIKQGLSLYEISEIVKLAPRTITERIIPILKKQQQSDYAELTTLSEERKSDYDKINFDSTFNYDDAVNVEPPRLRRRPKNDNPL